MGADKLDSRALQRLFEEMMMMIAFITINSGVVPLIEGLCAHILFFRIEIIGGLRSHLWLFFSEKKEIYLLQLHSTVTTQKKSNLYFYRSFPRENNLRVVVRVARCVAVWFQYVFQCVFSSVVNKEALHQKRTRREERFPIRGCASPTVPNLSK